MCVSADDGWIVALNFSHSNDEEPEVNLNNYSVICTFREKRSKAPDGS